MLLLADITSSAAFGALIGGVVGTALCGVMYVVALSSQRRGKAIGIPSKDSRTWTGDYRVGLNFARGVLEATGGQFVSEDPVGGLIVGRLKQSIFSFGSTVRIQFHGTPGAIQVDVSVAPTVSLTDMGISKRYLLKFVSEWDRRSAIPPSIYPRTGAPSS